MTADQVGGEEIALRPWPAVTRAAALRSHRPALTGPRCPPAAAAPPAAARRRRWRHECDSAHVAALEIGDESRERLGGVVAAEHDRVPRHRIRPRSHCEYQLVARHDGTARRLDLMPVGRYPRERVGHEASAEIQAQLRRHRRRRLPMEETDRTSSAGDRGEAADDRAVGDVGEQGGDRRAAAVVAHQESRRFQQRTVAGRAQRAAHARVDDG
jgi:hypothetical protein